MVFSAATILGGVCLLGLYLGIHDSLDRPYSNDATAAASSTEAALKPGMGAAAVVEAKPMQSDLPASSAPAKLADAKPKPKPSDDEDQSDEAPAASSAPAAQAHPPPEPPPLYPPDDNPTPPAQNDNNAPPY